MTLKRLTSALLVATVLVTSVPVYADPLPEAPALVVGEPDIGPAISPMKKGQTAPFTGVLLSPKASATITVELDSIAEKVVIEVARARAEEQAVCAYKVNETKIKLDADLKVALAMYGAKRDENKILSERLKKVEDDRPNVLLWTGLGAGGGIVLTVLTIFAVNSAQK